MREQLKAIQQRQEEAEQAVSDARRELTALLKPVLMTLNRPGYITASEEVVSFYPDSEGGLRVTTVYDRSDGTGSDNYHIPKEVVDATWPIAAADALVQRQRDNAVQRQREAGIAELRRLQAQYPDA